jgi:hypothetical protein
MCAQQAPKTLQEGDIREAVIRYQIKMWDLKAKVYFIAVNGKDPTEEFLRRFVDIELPVRKKSASKQKKDVVGWVVEKKTGKTGVIFDQNAIQWQSNTKVVVDGGYLCGGLCAAAGHYEVEYVEGRWTVKGFTATLMS